MIVLSALVPDKFLSTDNFLNVFRRSSVNAIIAVGIPISVVIAAVLIVLASVVLKYTTLGRYTYAIGNNRAATLYSGVNVERNLTLIYTLSGALVGIASMIATSRTVSAQPTAGI